MSYVLDTFTTDSYQYLECPGTTQVTVQVANAAVLIGFGECNQGTFFRAGAGTYPPADERLLPTVGGLSRKCDEIRVKSYAPGTPAKVFVTAR